MPLCSDLRCVGNHGKASSKAMRISGVSRSAGLHTRRTPAHPVSDSGDSRPAECSWSADLGHETQRGSPTQTRVMWVGVGNRLAARRLEAE